MENKRLRNINLFLLTLTSFCLGMLAILGYQKWQNQTTTTTEPPLLYNALAPNNNLNALDEDDKEENLKLEGDDPFEEMRKMRAKLLRSRLSEAEETAFDSWYQDKVGGGNVNEITRRETEVAVFYDLAIDELAPEQVKVKVIAGQLHLSGKIEKKTHSPGVSSFISSSFSRSFPAPENVDESHLKIHQTPGKITIEFPKKKSAS